MSELERTSELPPAKRRQILGGARQAFADLGYERASVDCIAARAGVAKATVYNHFEDKRALFIACYSEEADAMREELRASLGEPAGEVAEALQSIGEKLMAFLLSPAILTLYRHTISETVRFPEVGRGLWERGPQVLYDLIARWLARWGEKGVLRIEDPRVAAVQFVALCQSDLIIRARLGVLSSARPVKKAVTAAVRTFLRAYGA